MPVFKGKPTFNEIHIIIYIAPSSHILVKVKWGKERLDNVELNTDELPEVFKMQLFSLTGIVCIKHSVVT